MRQEIYDNLRSGLQNGYFLFTSTSKWGGLTKKNESEGDEIENASHSVENETLSVPRRKKRFVTRVVVRSSLKLTNYLTPFMVSLSLSRTRGSLWEV